MTFLRLILIGLLTGLSACGFQLRGLADLPPHLSSIELLGDRLDSDDQSRLVQLLQRAGAAISSASDDSTARLRVSVNDVPERLLVDSAGSGRRIVRLGRELSYSVIGADGNPLVDNKTLIATEDIELDENNLLANAAEKQSALETITENLFNHLLVQLQRL